MFTNHKDIIPGDTKMKNPLTKAKPKKGGHARSVVAAEKRALAGDNESQDSQVLLEKMMIEHGIGVVSSSPMSEDDDPFEEDTLLGKVSFTTPTSSRQIHHQASQVQVQEPPLQRHQDASNASVEDAVAQPPHTLSLPLSPTAFNLRPQSQPHNGRRISRHKDPSIGQDLAQGLIANNLHPSSSRPAKNQNQNQKRRGKWNMEDPSQSPTQSNDGRSYEQYAHDDTQSSRGDGSHDARSLNDDDTGAVRFDFHHTHTHTNTHPHTQDSLDEPAPNSIHKSPHSIPPYPPETPAGFPKLIQQVADEPLLGLSQLFRQTQYTSAIKKASPTSSRPSPNIFNHNPISPNPVISSPLKDRGLRTSPNAIVSSPAFPTHSSRPPDEQATSPRYSQDPDPARFNLQTSRIGPEPITEYRPSRDSEGDQTGTGDGSDQPEELDFDSYDTTHEQIRRSHIAKLRRNKADKSLSTNLPLNRTGFDDVEVPSTGQSKSRSIRQPRSIAEGHVSQCNGEYESDNDDNDGSQETIADSQGGQAPRAQDQVVYIADDNDTDEAEVDEGLPESSAEAFKDVPPETTTTTAAAAAATVGRRLSPGVLPTEFGATSGSRETIPETSPPPPYVQPPRPIGDIMNQYSSAASESAMIPIPELPSSCTVSAELGTKQDAAEGHVQHPDNHRQSVRPSSASVVPVSSRRSASPRLTEPRNVSTPIPATDPASEISSNTSSLTTLSATPDMSSSITPNTEPDGAHSREAQFPSSGPVASTLPVSSSPRARTSSPAEAKGQRRGRTKLPKTYSSTSVPSTVFRARIRRSSRHSSMSTDELARSSPSSAPADASLVDHGTISSRRPINTSTARIHAPKQSAFKHRLFDGMTFAVSFQGRQGNGSNDQYAGKTEKAKAAIERMIRQEGGQILDSGFNELFQFDPLSKAIAASTPVMSSSLKLLDQDTGFTALIADGHSRKVKYMQALALGLPCLAPKWIEICVTKGELVDWSSYLLCAGQSAILGEAIRSRNLQPYDPSMAKLAEVIDQRPKLLDGTQILLIMKARQEDKRLPYVFLARLLGGSLVRVHTIEEARAKLLEREARGEPFDWVYVDDQVHNAEEALFKPKGAGAPPKKRKRHARADDGDRPPKRIRTLNDELVIQSLILGRLIEEGEM